jgi:hypothetical protein
VNGAHLSRKQGVFDLQNQADPTGVQYAGDIQILGAQDELAGTIRGDSGDKECCLRLN